jgi:hypothetical protein
MDVLLLSFLVLAIDDEDGLTDRNRSFSVPVFVFAIPLGRRRCRFVVVVVVN